MKTYKQFVEGIDDDLKGDIDSISRAASDEAKDPIKGGGSKLNRIKGGKLLKKLLGPFTDKAWYQ